MLYEVITDTLKMSASRSLGFYYQEINRDSALHYHQQQLAWAQKLVITSYSIHYTKLYDPSLSYAKQDYNEIGSIAVHTLIQSINQEQVEASQFVNSMIVENHSTSRQ